MNKILIALAILLAILLILYSNSKVGVKSSIDGRIYIVKNNSISRESADLLATMNVNIIKLIKYIDSLDVKPVYYKNLKNFNPDNVHENILNLDTTYTIDKGKMILFCNGPRDEKTPKLYDINTMMYVAIHELGHVVSKSIGHTDEFKINFTDLLKKSIDVGVYKYVDYSKNPVDYCGIELTRSVLGSR